MRRSPVTHVQVDIMTSPSIHGGAPRVKFEKMNGLREPNENAMDKTYKTSTLKKGSHSRLAYL